MRDFKFFFWGGGDTCTFNGMHCGSYNLRELVNTSRINQVVLLACFNIFGKHMLALTVYLNSNSFMLDNICDLRTGQFGFS